ncbi:MAG: TPM domain-containing protein [bacterium]
MPFLSGRVNDTAQMLSRATIEELEATLKAHEDSTSNQVAVLTIATLQDEILEDYSMRVVETWKIGQANHDNGVLLLIVRDDRKMRIEVGSGLEGDLPDITCGRIIRHEITPRFRDGDFDGGVRAGVHAILAAAQGAYVAGEAEKSSSMDWRGRLLMFGIFSVVVGIFTLICIASEGFFGWFMYFFLIPFWLAFPMVSLGVKIGLTLFFSYLFGVGIFKLWLAFSQAGKEMMKKWGKRKWAATSHRANTWRGTGSGGYWSSSSSSSRSSGSSFSGGGGSFSGGGASGSW